jgi:ATP-dependent Lon protease
MSTDLDLKLKEQFGEIVVDKRFSRLETTGRLPRYLSEYLVSKYCGENPTESDIAHLVEFINLRFPQPRDRDKILHELMTKGEYNLIDEFKAITDLRRNTHWLKIPSLGVKASVLESILNRYDGLLTSGMWGLSKLEFISNSTDIHDSTNILMSEFTPFEVSLRGYESLHGFTQKRREFTLDEWIDVLVRTIGLNPDAYNRDQKTLLLSRIVPLVENNCNLMELGPKATGKTYFFRNISFYTRVISGGMVSPATLFYNIARDSIGEICIRDVIAFDEIRSIEFLGANKIIGKLKDYMTDGFFERGPKKASSNCSLVFLGNIEGNGELQIGDYNNGLPQFMRDTSFLDRLDGLLPGWDLPKIKQSNIHLATGLGLAVHYFAGILHELRKKHFYNYIEKRASFKGEMTIRDERGAKKITSGMLKILAPNGDFTDQELEVALQTGVSFRQRIANWLHRLAPHEFALPHFEYEILPKA